MRILFSFLSLLLIVSCSNKKPERVFHSEAVFDSLMTIDIPEDFILDAYYTPANKNSIRYKSKKGMKTITLKLMPNMFNDIRTAKSMMNLAAEDNNAHVLYSAFEDVNGTKFYIQESELKIDELDKWKVDGIAMLGSKTTMVNLSCYIKEEGEWNEEAKQILRSIKVKK